MKTGNVSATPDAPALPLGWRALAGAVLRDRLRPVPSLPADRAAPIPPPGAARGSMLLHA